MAADINKEVRGLMISMEWNKLTQYEAEKVAKKLKKEIKKNCERLEKDKPFTVRKKN